MQHRFLSESLGLETSSMIPFLSDGGGSGSGQQQHISGSSGDFLSHISLEAAAREAQNKAKYLLVVFISVEHESTAFFVESVLSNPDVVNQLRQSYLVYALPAPTDLIPYDALHTSSQTNTYTFLQQEGIRMLSKAGMSIDLVLPQATVLIKATRKVVGDISGGFDAGTFSKFLGSTVENIAGPVLQQEIVFAHDREEREQMRAYQDAELEEARRMDRLKKEEAEMKAIQEAEEKEEEARRRQAEEQAEMERLAKEAEEKRLEEEKRAHATNIMGQAQMVFDRLCGTKEPSPEDPKEAVCQLRLVDLKGKSHERLFFRSDTVAALYQYAQSLDPTYDGRPFRLVAGFPQRKPITVQREGGSASWGGDLVNNHVVHAALMKEFKGKLHSSSTSSLDEEDGLALDDSWVTIGECQPSLVPRAVVTLQEVLS